MACKDKCCCPVKRRPAKRKSTVGKVSATQLLAQSIASLALPRRANEPFLYGNSALGEAQKYIKVAENVLPKSVSSKSMSVGTETMLPKSVSVASGFEPESDIAKTIQNVNKPIKEGRKSFKPASEVVSKPFNVEQISTPLSGEILQRKSIVLPPMRNLSDDKIFKEMTTRQRYPTESITNTFSPNIPEPVNLNLTEGGLGRKIPGLKGIVGYKELQDFQFTDAGRPKKVDIQKAII